MTRIQQFVPFSFLAPLMLCINGDLALSQGHSVQYRASVTDMSGVPIATIDLDELFYLNVSVQDIRDEPTGVFAAYVDERAVAMPARQCDRPFVLATECRQHG